MADAKYGLGRGLGSLIPKKAEIKKQHIDFSDGSYSGDEIFASDKDRIVNIDINKIKANPYQPRTHFDEEKLEDLVNSIREHGILQPIVVTKNGDGYELIAGERRLKAAKILKLFKVPGIIKEIDDSKKLELAIIENIQRQNLNLLEESDAYNRLMEEFNLTQDQVAKKVGKSRSSVANILRLRSLPESIKKYLNNDKISFGHAKLLLSLDDEKKQKLLLDRILSESLNVSETSSVLKKINVKSHSRIVEQDPNIKSMESSLQEHLNTKVKLNDKKGKGTIVIDYYSKEELREILFKILK
ncbi:MAG: ParB/RepB/Spo0J family partition protein [Patescibacteria group bacterium]|nr:ParB/RepB/Spo0J family partition protein [Patescibacteria group bacterium]